MADVFIAYQHEEKRIAEIIADVLRDQSLETWFDYDLVPGTLFAGTIEQQIREAKAVLVLWSHSSINSSWVREEADLAGTLGKLIPISIDGTAPPLGFRQYHTPHFQEIDWRNLEREPQFQNLIRDIIAFIRRPVSGIDSSAKKPETSEPVAPGESGQEWTAGVKESHSGLRDRRYRRLPSAWRTRLFVAHASPDKPRIKPIIELLVMQGFKIWIDKPHELKLEPSIERKLSRNRIRNDADWPEQIRLAASNSDVVLGFWSREALQGDRRQFNYELYMGLIQGKLRQCRFDNLTESEIGYPYSFIQMANISDYKPNIYHPELDYLMEDIAKRPILGLL